MPIPSICIIYDIPIYFINSKNKIKAHMNKA